MTTSVNVTTQEVHVHQNLNIPMVETVAELDALDPAVMMAIFRRPSRALMFPMFANSNIPEVDVRVKHLSQRFLLIRGDSLLTWAGNSNASPQQAAKFGYIDIGNPATFDDPSNGDWLVPAADVATAEVLPYGWTPVHLQ